MKALLYKKLENKNVKCLACEKKCVINEGKIGNCGVRQNKKGELDLLVWGKPIAVHIDPIEKKPLFHFLPGAKSYSIGTLGCNFMCDFCQNWDISQFSKLIKKSEILKKIKTKDDLLTPEKIIDFCLRNKIEIIAYTYNEPTVFIEYAYDIGKLAKKYGLKNIFVTNGYQSKESFGLLEEFLDGANIDLKSFNKDFYKRLCKAELSVVLKNIKEFYKRGFFIEITTLLIPGENDSEKEIKEIAKFIKSISEEIPWHLTAFYPAYKMENHSATSFVVLKKAYNIAKEQGLKYVYTGNIPGYNTENTYCPKCNAILIERFGIKLIKNNIKLGRCFKCGLKIPGVWK